MHWQYVLQPSKLQQSRRNTSLPRLSPTHQCTAGLVTARQAGAGRYCATAGSFAVGNGDATAAGHSAKTCHGTSLFRSHLFPSSKAWSLPGLSHFPRRHRQVTGEAHVAKRLSQIPSPVPIYWKLLNELDHIYVIMRVCVFFCFVFFWFFNLLGWSSVCFLMVLGSSWVPRHVNASIGTTRPNAMVK